MKKIIALTIMLFALFSCESPEEKQKLLDAKIKQQKIIEAEQSEERKILEKQRIKAKILRNKAEQKARRAQDELLGNSLIEQTALLNKQAFDVLNSKPSSTWILWEHDLLSDDSLTKFVNNKTSFTDIKYVPKNLIKLEWEYIEDTKWNSTLRQEALSALDNLAQNFYLEFTRHLKVVSAYRSYEYQKGIKDRWCEDSLCAKAWYSEHQTGLAVDLWEASEEQRFQSDETLSSYFEWMNKEAYKYWFTNTYQKGIEIDGYEIEPWHWRYVWEELALILHEYKITFTEYTLSPESY